MVQGHALLLVKGMNDGDQARRVGEALLSVPGVEDVQIDLAFSRVRVMLNTQQPPSRDQLTHAIDDTGLMPQRVEMNDA